VEKEAKEEKEEEEKDGERDDWSDVLVCGGGGHFYEH